MSRNSNTPPVSQPWWRFGMVWMVVGGPAVVVVAGLTTFYIAASHPDPVLLETPRTALQERQGITHAPAMQGRNHAASGELPQIKPAAGKPNSDSVAVPATAPAQP